MKGIIMSGYIIVCCPVRVPPMFSVKHTKQFMLCVTPMLSIPF